MSEHHAVVIVGGGFAGLDAARGLGRGAVDVTLIDRRNVHLFQPLLYQVATGGLSPGDIASPLRWILRRNRNTRVWLGQATALDVEGRRVLLGSDSVRYDTLVVAVGVKPHYFGHEEWSGQAPGLKSIEDALEIRSRILLAFERAEREADPARVKELLTFVVIGAGPTGVELAGTLSELAHHTLRKDFRAIDTTKTQILLIDGADRVLPPFPESLSAKCHRSLERLGVTVCTGTFVTGVGERWVDVKTGDRTGRIPTATLLWAAGVRAQEFGAALAHATGAQPDAVGRIIVESDCTVPGHPEIFVIGDLANFAHPGGDPLPGLAPVAMQQGRYVAETIRRRLAGKPVKPFRYRNKGQLATIGRAAAVADLGPHLRFSGYPAWLLWLFVHLMYIVEFQNRVLVLVQWAWHYFARNRGPRIISQGRHPPTGPETRNP